ncbi:MAG TPA: outer membrane lipoprotein carrier protein LolA [Flavipsychrobacter sp.]|nr:outer membrane lipoprotein carrier protein LolA [Flavipsychrobacter sp.]
MNKFFLTLLLSISSFVLYAQPKGYQPVNNLSAFQQSLTKSNAAVQTIMSDFVQTKNLSLLADKIKSKGKFYFKKENKVRIEYTTPYTYLLVMNGGQLMVKDEEKTSKINTRSSKTMQSVNRIIIDCMQGTVFHNTDFKVAAYENSQSYLLSLEPATDAMRKMFKKIDVYMNKKDFDVHKLTMTEQGGDFTDMDFINTQHNVALNENLFKIK